MSLLTLGWLSIQHAGNGNNWTVGLRGADRCGATDYATTNGSGSRIFSLAGKAIWGYGERNLLFVEAVLYRYRELCVTWCEANLDMHHCVHCIRVTESVRSRPRLGRYLCHPLDSF